MRRSLFVVCCLGWSLFAVRSWLLCVGVAVACCWLLMFFVSECLRLVYVVCYCLLLFVDCFVLLLCLLAVVIRDWLCCLLLFVVV